MKAVILAGGFGSRLSEETHLIPKPMVKIGEKPILWHIMKLYSFYGINEFVICLGYKGYVIKEWFSNYFLHNSDVTLDIQNNKMEIHNVNAEPWKVTLVETGLNTMTGGRIKRIEKYVKNERFMLTYGDGVSNIDINELLNQHIKSQKILTVSAYKPSGKFGAIDLDNNSNVKSFTEKPAGDGMWINAGFCVCEPEVFNYLNDNENLIFEKQPLENIARENKMYAFKHNGFWKAMDTLRDNADLNKMWNEKKTPWKVW